METRYDIISGSVSVVNRVEGTERKGESGWEGREGGQKGAERAKDVCSIGHKLTMSMRLRVFILISLHSRRANRNLTAYVSLTSPVCLSLYLCVWLCISASVCRVTEEITE